MHVRAWRVPLENLPAKATRRRKGPVVTLNRVRDTVNRDMVPFRAALTVGDFDHRRSELVVSRDKAGNGRRILLPDLTVALLRGQARSKLPAARLFIRADGLPWDKDAWKGPIKEAVRAAGLPESATAYTLRHSTITDLVTGGLDLLTIAQVSGTSVAMIERHYGHLRREHARDALAMLAL